MNFAPTLILVASLATAHPVATPVNRPVDLRGSINGAAQFAAKTTPLPRAAVFVASPPKQSKRSVVGLVLGGVAGLWAGAVIGYKAEHAITDGRCYDVCFRGLVIGAPIGALIGGTLGWKFLGN